MQRIKIKSIKKKDYDGKVYNLAVEKDETYLVNDIAVHNCRSDKIDIFEGEPWTESPTLSVGREF